ncbi:hypothetical protein [Silvibacterium sp.]|uniref:hypothetical protein n=1 Tax=Silvibacterium sp. TaxID=1964179 RepID=UPI0039E458B9
MTSIAVGLLQLLSACGTSSGSSSSLPVVHASGNEETIVLIRHGEIATGGLGQLSCKGFDRSLLLPQVFARKFGTPDAIFAPNPSVQVHEGPAKAGYSYVRPLATIEPTAIRLGLPVNTQYGYSDVAALQTAVTSSAYAKSTVFIAWEHGYAHRFAKNLLTAYGVDPSVVPTWAESDFDMIYVFHIEPPAAGGSGAGQLTFEVEHEGLNESLESACAD